MLEVEFGPHALQKEDLRVLVRLPEHKIAKALNTTGPDKEI